MRYFAEVNHQDISVEEKPHIGYFETVDENSMSFQGVILDPHTALGNPVYKVDGEFLEKDEKLSLSFVKIPTSPTILEIFEIFYTLEKIDGSNERAGSYEGHWNIRERGIRPGIGYKPDIGIVATVTEYYKPKGRATLTLMEFK